jgi:mutator protein MutT
MKILEVAAGVIFERGRLLIAQRFADSHLGGLWEFPGGKRESNESFQECLVRELEEELGVRVEVGEELESLTHSYPEKTVYLKFFRCRLTSGIPAPLGCAAIKWIPASELDQHDFPAADAHLIKTLRERQDLWA